MLITWVAQSNKTTTKPHPIQPNNDWTYQEFLVPETPYINATPHSLQAHRRRIFYLNLRHLIFSKACRRSLTPCKQVYWERKFPVEKVFAPCNLKRKASTIIARVNTNRSSRLRKTTRSTWTLMILVTTKPSSASRKAINLRSWPQQSWKFPQRCVWSNDEPLTIWVELKKQSWKFLQRCVSSSDEPLTIWMESKISATALPPYEYLGKQRMLLLYGIISRLHFMDSFHGLISWPHFMASFYGRISWLHFMALFHGFTSCLHFVTSFHGFISWFYFMALFHGLISRPHFTASFHGLISWLYIMASFHDLISWLHFMASFHGFIS